MIMLRLSAAAACLIATVSVAGAAPVDGKTKDERSEMVCKEQKRTDSRFTTRTCRTRAQWEEAAEQQKRDYAETRNRPVIETRRDN